MPPGGRCGKALLPAIIRFISSAFKVDENVGGVGGLDCAAIRRAVKKGVFMDTVKPRDGQKEKSVVKTPFGTITRRNFVKAAAATAATAGIAGGLLGCASR